MYSCKWVWVPDKSRSKKFLRRNSSKKNLELNIEKHSQVPRFTPVDGQIWAKVDTPWEQDIEPGWRSSEARESTRTGLKTLTNSLFANWSLDFGCQSLLLSGLEFILSQELDTAMDIANLLRLDWHLSPFFSWPKCCSPYSHVSSLLYSTSRSLNRRVTINSFIQDFIQVPMTRKNCD